MRLSNNSPKKGRIATCDVKIYARESFSRATNPHSVGVSARWPVGILAIVSPNSPCILPNLHYAYIGRRAVPRRPRRRYRLVTSRCSRETPPRQSWAISASSIRKRMRLFVIYLQNFRRLRRHFSLEYTRIATRWGNWAPPW